MMPVSLRVTMRRMSPTRPHAAPLPLLLAAICSLLAACVPSPAPVPVLAGSRLPAVSLEDQHGVSHTLDDELEVVLFSRDMEGGAVIRELLLAEGPELLERRHAVYVTDISGMPSLIANTMAIPKMRRERPYPTLLDRDGSLTAGFPSREGSATVLRVEALRVRDVLYVTTIGELRSALGD